MSGFRTVKFLPRQGQDKGLLAGVIGVMVFLSFLAAVVGVYLNEITGSLSADMTTGLSIQIVSADKVENERQVKAVLDLLADTPGVESAERLPLKRLTELLEPWLGVGNVSDELPIPEMIAVTLDTRGQIDTVALEASLKNLAPDARLDDHQQWVGQARSVIDMIKRVAVLSVFLIGLATVAIVIFATHARLSNHRRELELVHLMGAEDRVISAEFRNHFMVHGLKGSLLGVFFAILMIAGIRFLLPPLSEFGLAVSLPTSVWATIVLAIPLLATVITMLTAELTVRRALLRML